jgi:hypothetical protein
MPSLTSLLRRVGRLLAGQLGRLHDTLERIAGEVRAAIARAISQATGETVREALRVILDGPLERPGYHDRTDDRDGGWGQSRRPTWPSTRSSYDSYSRDPYERDPYEDPDEDRQRRYADPDQESPADEPSSTHRQGSWSRVVAVGCQAAAWWLRRHTGPFSLVTAAGIGIAAGFATFVSSPLVSGASAVAASALGLLALADAASSAAGLADQVVK